jgi:hypothetical protein
MTQRQKLMRNVLPPVVVVAVLAASWFIYVGHRSPTLICYGNPTVHVFGTKSSLAPLSSSGASAAAPVTTLPPSRDNDAGITRIPDSTPDADSDTRQKPKFCLANGHRVPVP